MSEWSPLVNGIVTGGLGVTAGSIVTTLLQMWGKKGESRARAADLVTGAAERIITRLDRENQEMREAIILLTDVLDQVLPEIHATPATLDKLKRAKQAAQRAV